MNDRQTRLYVYRGSLPFWLAAAVALPLGALFLTSLVLAAALLLAGAGVAALLLPMLRRRPPGDDSIELDPSQYRRVEQRRPGDER